MTTPIPPAWLPEIVPFKGDWNAFVRALYAIFEKDFKCSIPRFRSFPVWHNQKVEPGDKYGFEEGFWHLVSRDEWVYDRVIRRKEKQRLPEFDRAGRLPWAKPMIHHDGDPSILVWDYEEESSRGKVVRSYLWIKEHDYVVILERQTANRGAIFKLITSFHVCYEAKRKDLESRYGRRIK